MGRLVLVAYVALAFLFAYYYASLGEGTERRPAPRRVAPELASPEPAGPERGERPAGNRGPLPGPSPRDPSLTVDDSGPCRRACTGTAFAIDDSGWWMTARHVINGCREVGVVTGARRAVAAEVAAIHPRADLALLRTARSAPPLAIGGGPLFPDQNGFHFGFPQGVPGAVSSRLIGRVGLRSTAGRGARQPGIAWAEVDRAPRGNGPLGGLSGGPVLASSGAVVGVAIAASPRRGRVISAAPVSMAELLAQAGLDLSRGPGPAEPVDARDYARLGERLRGRLTVAQIYCRGQGARRPRG